MSESASAAESVGDHREDSSPFLRACRGLPTERTPVWLMRQAGRYMPEYRAIRARHSMLEAIQTPELAAEITLQPLRAFGFDAGIIFADILPPLIGMGLRLDFVADKGPVIDNPVETTRDIDRLATPPAEETLAGTLRAIEMVKAETTTPLIGFAGAPFTLASYAIEGGGSKSWIKTKRLILCEPAAWRRLMEKLVTVQADYLLAQANAGADALQVFDSWVGLALGRLDYQRFVAPYNRSLFERLGAAGVPTIHFSQGTAGHLADVAETGGDVIGVDWRMPLDWCRQQLGAQRPIQGNLDPCALLAPWRELRHRIDDVLARAGGRPGHIFNLGHGIFPQTPVDSVRRLVERVREHVVAPAE
ncbi:MAG TPA: uroporphyrinogen decarboxylase [Thermoanaerobaculia bacterium]|nr:uroporphyrinogen decarboxylase [Thermoanaerobaculia bacterium]